MPDWKQFVRKQLQLIDVAPVREAEIVEEVAQQLEEVYSEELRSGKTEQQARLIAEQHISDWRIFARQVSSSQTSHRTSLISRAELAAESHVSENGWRSRMSELARDALYGARVLRKNPRFALIAVVTIALGIGATTAIFSVVNSVILRPLPYDDPDRIVWIWGKFSQGDRAAVSPPDFLDYRSQAKSFEKIAAMHVMHQFVPAPMNLLSSQGPPIRFDSATVTAGFFEVFGARATLGRTFLHADEKQDARVAILSHKTWQESFASDPNIIGKTLNLNQVPLTVVGVIQEGFAFPLDVDLWVPMVFDIPEMKVRKFHFLRPLARLRQGVSIEQGHAQLATIARQLEQQYPETNQTWTIRLEHLQHQIVGDLKRPLYVIFTAVCFLLLIACLNVTNLLLARTTARHKEIAIRVAIGAGRARIIKQLFAESLMLSLPAGSLGFLLAYWSIDVFKAAGVDFLPRLQEIHLDTRTLIFTICCTIITAIVISLAPVLDVLPRVFAARLKEGKYSGTRSASGRMRHSLAVAEVALSLLLLTGAGLLLKSFWKLTNVELGFQPQNLLTVRVSLNEAKYPTAESVIRFTEATVTKVRALPGVEAAAAGNGLPLVPAGGDRFFTIEGETPATTNGDKPNAQFRAVTRDYFRALGIGLIRGRGFTTNDTETSTKVVVINDALAGKFFGTEDPIGRRLDIDVGSPFTAEIIGVVKGTRQNIAEIPQPEMYVLHQQSPIGYFLLAVRSQIGAGQQTAAIRAAFRELDKEMTFPKFRTMDDIIGEAALRKRLNAILLASAASVALILAAIGIYGVLSFAVEQRQHEIGVRMALGAKRRDIVSLIFRHGVRIAFLGLSLGLGGALILTRLMQSLLFEVSPSDPAILTSVSVLLTLVALVACLVPARRAARLDPLRTLRYE